MTVKELIETLKTCDESANVVIELIETLKTYDENANVVIEQWDVDIYGIGEVNDYSSNIDEAIIVID